MALVWVIDENCMLTGNEPRLKKHKLLWSDSYFENQAIKKAKGQKHARSYRISVQGQWLGVFVVPV